MVGTEGYRIIYNKKLTVANAHFTQIMRYFSIGRAHKFGFIDPIGS